jgi:hypothetical protein
VEIAMADTVHRTRVPNSQRQSDAIADPTRRALLAAIPAAAIGTAALAPAARALRSPPIEAEASDALFLAWEREWNGLAAQYQKGLSEEEVERIWRAQVPFENLIFETPSASIVAARVKTRLFLKSEVSVIQWRHSEALDHILAALQAA